MRRLLIGLGVLLVLGLCGFAWLVVVYPNLPPSGHGSRTVALQLPEHAALQDVISQLSAAGLVQQPRVFALYARAMRAEPHLRQGRVLVTSQMTARELLQRVAQGYGSTRLLITVPEGWNRFDIAGRLADWNVCSRADFLRAVDAAQPLTDLNAQAHGAEGYLFPDTYWLRDETPAAQVVARLTENAKRRIERLLQTESTAFAQLQADYGFGLRELVILASIVEKEAHVPSELPLIAGVFLNRLRDPSFVPKRLQADPTVAYGCMLSPELASCADFDGRHVTHGMLLDPANRYNTYRLDGLPPAPISNPGLAALNAVLHPAHHSYFYFVARGDGRHTFSSTLESHNVAVHQGLPPRTAAAP